MPTGATIVAHADTSGHHRCRGPALPVRSGRAGHADRRGEPDRRGGSGRPRIRRPPPAGASPPPGHGRLGVDLRSRVRVAPCCAGVPGRAVTGTGSRLQTGRARSLFTRAERRVIARHDGYACHVCGRGVQLQLVNRPDSMVAGHVVAFCEVAPRRCTTPGRSVWTVPVVKEGPLAPDAGRPAGPGTCSANRTVDRAGHQRRAGQGLSSVPAPHGGNLGGWSSVSAATPWTRWRRFWATHQRSCRAYAHVMFSTTRSAGRDMSEVLGL